MMMVLSLVTRSIEVSQELRVDRKLLNRVLISIYADLANSENVESVNGKDEKSKLWGSSCNMI